MTSPEWNCLSLWVFEARLIDSSGFEGQVGCIDEIQTPGRLAPAVLDSRFVARPVRSVIEGGDELKVKERAGRYDPRGDWHCEG